MRSLVFVGAILCLPPIAAAEEDQPDGRWEWLQPLRVRGRLAEDIAYRLHDPGDLSKFRTTGWLEGKYTVSETVNLRLGMRGWYDAVFDVTDRFPRAVERDQKTEFSIREALLSASPGDLQIRIGKQQIVWGEAIGTFVTDVVNPRDLREFVLPDFTEIRIPIWAVDLISQPVRGVTVEAVWTPNTRVNELPKDGAEFQFAPIPFRFRNPVIRRSDHFDDFSLTRSEGGARLSMLVDRWDASIFYYDQNDKTAVLFQRRLPQAQPSPDVILLEPEHPRVHIVGATLTRGTDRAVFRSEVAATIGKQYETTDPLDLDGVVRRDTIDYLVGLDYTFPNLDAALQLSQKILAGSATNLTRGGVEGQVTTSMALRLATKLFSESLRPSMLFAINANRGDFRLSLRADYLLSDSITVSVGSDLFDGRSRTLYGQFRRNDRVYVTTTWRF